MSSDHSGGTKFNAVTIALAAAGLLVLAIAVRGLSSSPHKGPEAAASGGQQYQVAAPKAPAQPACPTAETIDSSPAPVGMMDVTAPAVTDPTHPEADVNWTPWIRSHPGNSLGSPGFPNPSIRVEYVNAFTCQIDPEASTYMSAARFQSTSNKPVPMKYGYMKTS